MKITYQTDEGSLSREFDSLADRAIFLREPFANPAGDHDGGYFYLFPERQTRYEGWYVNGARINQPFFKLLDRVNFYDPSGHILSVEEIIIYTDYIVWVMRDGTEVTFALDPEMPALHILSSSKIIAELLFDIRGIYTEPKWGRSYHFENSLLTYSDPLLGREIFLAVNSDGSFLPKKSWQEEYFPRDAKRNSNPINQFTYCLGQFCGQKLTLGFGWNPSEAQKSAMTALHIKQIDSAESNEKYSIPIAAAGARQALKHLKNSYAPDTGQHNEGYWAGLPWFHQVWSRDELITALGLSKAEQKEIISRYLLSQMYEGQLPTYIGSNTFCADGLGWLCLLIKEYGLDNFTLPEKEKIKKFLIQAEEEQTSFRLHENGLVWANHNATWMDTIGREGFPVEIQFMRALLLKLLIVLTDEQKYQDAFDSQKEKILEYYWVNLMLYDGFLDPTIRPNVFLCYLLAPEILASEDWKICFDKTLAVCKTEWGGLSSIDKNDPKFVGLTSGENNISYHNGDSWFFVNNLAAIALYRLDKQYYAKDIENILNSGAEEIIWHHKLGFPGEISSADLLDSFGCGLQGFSSGSYLFLLGELDARNQ